MFKVKKAISLGIYIFPADIFTVAQKIIISSLQLFYFTNPVWVLKNTLKILFNK